MILVHYAPAATPSARRILRWIIPTTVGCLLVLSAGVSASAGHSSRQVALVGNLRGGTVTVIDERSLRVLGSIDVTPDGKTPRDPAQAKIYPALVKAKGVNYVQGVALSPDGHTVYVSRGYLGDVAAFDIASGRLLWRLEVAGVRADHVALSPDGRRLFVSALTADEVEVINTQTHRFIGSFPTGDWAHVLEFTPDGRYIVNGSLGDQLLPAGSPTRFWMTFADPATLQVKRVLKFDAGVRPFAFSPSGKLVYAQFSYFNGFKVVDTATGRIVRSIPLPVSGPAVGEPTSQYPNQAAHHGIALSGDASMICDAATVSNYVALVARRSLKTRAILPVGDQPADTQTSSDGQLCFVSNRGNGPGGNTVSVISFSRRREIARIRVGLGPQEIVVGSIPDAVLRRARLLRSHTAGRVPRQSARARRGAGVPAARSRGLPGR